jgi:heptosyltransferase-2
MAARLRGRVPDSLIVRLPNWLGDTVMAVPALRALRDAYPGMRTALAGPWAALLAGQGLADTLVTYPRAWLGRLRMADTVGALRAGVALLLPNSFEAALTARYWGAGRRIGFATGGRCRLLTDAIPLPSPRRHQVDEYLSLLEPLGERGADATPRLVPLAADSEERREVRALLADAGAVASGAPLIGVHLGAAYGASKVWPAEHVAAFCAEVRSAAAVPVLLGSGADRRLAEDVMSREAVPSLVGRDRPESLPALLAEIDALVCGDTGVGHLAAALGTPVVALFGPTDPALTAPRGRVDVLSHPVPCSPCFLRECPIEHPCLRGLAPAQVAALALASRSATGFPGRSERWGGGGGHVGAPHVE